MKAAMILAGCGFLDGAEIHEATLLMLALKEKGIDVDFFSLDQEVNQPISHLTKEPTAQKQNMMEMSARIARGKILNMKILDAMDYDILGMPGGFGVANNFSDWAEKGTDCTVNHEVSRVIRGFFEAKKVIVGMCISPMIIGRVLQGSGVRMTVGSDAKQIKILESMGIDAVSCKIDEACIDKNNRIYTVPAYMEKPDIAKIYQSLKKVQEVL